jgi:hypothetical protein
MNKKLRIINIKLIKTVNIENQLISYFFQNLKYMNPSVAANKIKTAIYLSFFHGSLYITV